MYSLFMVAALTCGYCDGAGCAVETTVCSGACDHDHVAATACVGGGHCRLALPGQPVRRAVNLVRAIAERQPVRSRRLLRRVLGRAFGRRCH